AGGRGGDHGRPAELRVRDLYRKLTRAGVGGTHRPGPDRAVLGAQQRLRLAGGLPVGAPARRRLGPRRRGRRWTGVRAAPAAPNEGRRPRRGPPPGGLPRSPPPSSSALPSPMRTWPTAMPWRRSGPDGRPCAPISGPCWRPAPCGRVHRGRCTPTCAPPRGPATPPAPPAREPEPPPEVIA